MAYSWSILHQLISIYIYLEPEETWLLNKKHHIILSNNAGLENPSWFLYNDSGTLPFSRITLTNSHARRNKFCPVPIYKWKIASRWNSAGVIIFWFINCRKIRSTTRMESDKGMNSCWKLEFFNMHSSTLPHPIRGLVKTQIMSNTELMKPLFK